MQNQQHNIITIEFFNKNSFPPGDWKKEPDLCDWESYGLQCLALRDMKLGMWRGFVALTENHKFYNKPLFEINEMSEFEVYGGITIAGQLPAKFKDLNKDKWWVGFECCQGQDLLPLVKMDLDNPIYKNIRDHQTYKNLHFVRKEINNLAKQLLRINK